jgi:hypothetical protein
MLASKGARRSSLSQLVSQLVGLVESSGGRPGLTLDVDMGGVFQYVLSNYVQKVEVSVLWGGWVARGARFWGG